MKLINGTQIRPLDAQINTTVSLVPKLPFSAMLSASKGGGKSTLLLNMLLSKDILAGKFNKIYWISPTSSLDTKITDIANVNGVTIPNILLINELKKLKKKTKILDSVVEEIDNDNDIEFIDDPSIAFLSELIGFQKSIINTFNKKTADKVLLIYDDCAGEQKFWNSSTVKKMIFNSRHFNISTIITTQAYHSISKPIRLNMSMFLLFETGNEIELKTIYDENSSGLKFKDWLSIYKNIINQQFNFMVINYQNNIANRIQNAFSSVPLKE